MNQIAKREANDIEIDGGDVVLRKIDDLDRLAEWALKNGLGPKQATLAVIKGCLMVGMQLRKPASWALRWVANVNGALSVWGAGLNGLVQGHPMCGGVLLGSFSGQEMAAFLAMEFPGDDTESRLYRALKMHLSIRAAGRGDVLKRGNYHVAYSVALRNDRGIVGVTLFDSVEAEQAGLASKGGVWRSYERDMLMWKANGRMAARFFPDAYVGDPDVVEDGEAGEAVVSVASSEVLTKMAPVPPPSPTAPREVVDAEVVEAPPKAGPTKKDELVVELGKLKARNQKATMDVWRRLAGQRSWAEISDEEAESIVEDVRLAVIEAEGKAEG